MRQHSFARVIGRFEYDPPSGSIDYVVPAGTEAPPESDQNWDQRLRLVGYNADGQTLFTHPVQPLFNSCVQDRDAGTFEESIRSDSGLTKVSLWLGDVELDSFEPGAQPQVSPTLGPPGPDSHHLPIEAPGAPVGRGVTYTVQARPDDSDRWVTLGVGLASPAEASVNVNQFPGAGKLDVRVFQSDGFQERLVMEETRKFEEEA